MICPKCGSYNVYTVDSRLKDGMQWRRRACTDCAHRFNTVEIPMDDYNKLMEDKNDK